MSIRKTGWTYNATPENEEATRISRRFIGLFRQALAEQNCQAMGGIENEFHLLQSDGKKTYDENLTSEVWNQFEEKRKENRQILEKFEIDKISGNETYEFTHHPSDLERAAIRTAALNQYMYARTKEGVKNYQGASEPPERIRDDQRHFGVEKIRFNPLHAGQTFAQQMNISLWMGQDKPASFSPSIKDLIKAERYNLMTNPYFSDVVINNYQILSENDALLLLPTKNSYERISGYYTYPPESLAKVAIKRPEASAEAMRPPEEARVEYRLPDASANPFFIALVAMAASYMAMSQAKDALKPHDWGVYVDKAMLPEKNVMTGTLPKNLEESMLRFKNRSKLVNVMRSVAQQYGTAEDVALVDRFRQLVITDAKVRLKSQRTRYPSASL